MDEVSANRGLPMLERVAYASGLAAPAAFILSVLYTNSFNTSLAASGFLLAAICAFSSVGMLLGHARLGAVIGLLAGALYLGMLFRSMPNGGHWPDVPGWPITIPLE